MALILHAWFILIVCCRPELVHIDQLGEHQSSLLQGSALLQSGQWSLSSSPSYRVSDL